MKRRGQFITLVLACGITYLITAWSYEAGPFAANYTRDLQAQTQSKNKWAQPLSVEGLPNFHLVSPQLYRGAQPTPDGLANLRSMGIRTIVNLRNEDDERATLQGWPIEYNHITMDAWKTPNDADVVEFLKIATDKTRWPVFVHCMQGADRTGTMVAVYRIVVQNWTKADAINEMKKGGFGHHSIFFKLTTYLNGLDVDSLRKQAGLTTPLPQSSASKLQAKASSPQAPSLQVSSPQTPSLQASSPRAPSPQAKGLE